MWALVCEVCARSGRGQQGVIDCDVVAQQVQRISPNQADSPTKGRGQRLVVNRDWCAGPLASTRAAHGRSAIASRGGEKGPTRPRLVYVHVCVIRGPHEPAGVGRYYRPTMLIIIVMCGVNET